MSPQASMVGRASLDWDMEVFWPQPMTDADLNVAVNQNDTLYVSTANLMRDRTMTRTMVTSQGALGTGSVNYTAGAEAGVPGGLPVARFLCAAGPPDRSYIGLGGMRAILDTTGAVAMALGAAWPSLQRVWWLRALIRHRDDGGGPPTNESGMLVMPSDSIQTPWPANAVGPINRGGFGFVGDGAGQWQYASYDRTGIFLLREAVALPVHTLDTFNMVEWVMVGARPGFNAYIEFWFNNTLIVTRNWLGGMLEPIGGALAVNINEWHWVPHIRQQGIGGMFVTGVVNRQGRFLRDGTELQG